MDMAVANKWSRRPQCVCFADGCHKGFANPERLRIAIIKQRRQENTVTLIRGKCPSGQNLVLFKRHSLSTCRK